MQPDGARRRRESVLRAHEPFDRPDGAAVVFRGRGDERREPRRHALAREEERDAVQVSGVGLQRVHAHGAVDVHVDEARVERQPFEV
jgi:hypothetical protein